ncbi:MAG: Gfo/Idh/MocA family oxidoreductase [Kiritimatiellae bacterium]|nr:Gfo/Idh/MocA family oxidoreductase [Kiritimatiellia bacterium]
MASKKTVKNRTTRQARKKRYAVVGLGGRSAMYTRALYGDYKAHGQLVGFCDINQTRMDHWNALYAEQLKVKPVPTYKPEDFDRMIREQKVDAVIVTSMDRTHHRYIIRAMELGCDAITEKPMTVDARKCQAILDTQKRTGRRLTVTFNYRYSPRNSRVREVIQSGAIGRVLSVHFEWLLDTVHGADYFRRWHRDKRNSGGLMVHKATHHFDLVNWWIDSHPEVVFGFGDLVFYGRENAEERGETRFYHRCHGSTYAENDPWAIHLAKNPKQKGLYLDAEHEDGYYRDMSVFGHYISIEDDMAVLVRYRSGATMSYHLTAYSPWEGYRVMFNGTRGRLEVFCEEKSYVSGAKNDFNMPELRQLEPIENIERPHIVLRPLWGKPVNVPYEQARGGHGGGDVRLLHDLFVGGRKDPLKTAASHIDGAMSIMTGICANESFKRGLPVRVDELVRIPE